MNRTAGGKWVVTNTYAEYGKHHLCVWAVNGVYGWSVFEYPFIEASGTNRTLHAARVAAKRASARIQGLGYSGVKAR